MKIAILSSNYGKTHQDSTRGPDVFVYSLVEQLAKNNNYQITSFVSGDSTLPGKIFSIDETAILLDRSIPPERRKLFELALISEAISQENQFDIFHVNISNGEYVLPFLSSFRTPVLITLHSPFSDGDNDLYSRYKHLKNVFFVPISNYQKSKLPDLNYTKTIYHGINTDTFIPNNSAKETLLWSGRGVPEKGMDDAIEVMRAVKRPGRIIYSPREKYVDWANNIILNKPESVLVKENIPRSELISEYQSAKLFLMPVHSDEAFGLVMIEAMACGTPVIAYAKGSVPEIIKDGETGFIVNRSEDDRRGDWIIKKTGIEGLREAAERICEMPQDEYVKMRLNCRKHVEDNFTLEKMVTHYEELYNNLKKDFPHS